MQSTLVRRGRELPNRLYNRLRADVWSLAGSRTVRVGDAEATLVLADSRESRMLDFDFRTEKPILSELLTTLTEDDVFWDVGSHVGLYACLAAETVEPTNVAAFEPSPGAFGRLQQNVEANGGGVEGFEVALSDSDGYLEMPVHEKPGSGTRIVDESVATGTAEVRTMRGETFVREGNHPRPTVLKIDVEGNELAVLRGMGDLLDSVRAIFCELHTTYLSEDELAECFDILSVHGFETRDLNERTLDDSLENGVISEREFASRAKHQFVLATK